MCDTACEPGCAIPAPCCPTASACAVPCSRIAFLPRNRKTCVNESAIIAELIYQSQTAPYALGRRRAIHMLGDRFSCVCHPEIMAAFIYALNDCDERVRSKAADEIGDQVRKESCCCNQAVVCALTTALADVDYRVRREATQGLRLCGYDVVDGRKVLRGRNVRTMTCSTSCDTTCCPSGCCPTGIQNPAPISNPIPVEEVSSPVVPTEPAMFEGVIPASDYTPVPTQVLPVDEAPAPPAEGEAGLFSETIDDETLQMTTQSRSLKNLFGLLK
ncbi:MAG: HEAT repeat domain-containing protein [Planctomycetaceae bacterium]|nr:HEAT repeat domain-containing protein [Planctomycetaceae bacterium]